MMKIKMTIMIAGLMFFFSLAAEAGIPQNFKEIKGVPKVKSEVWPGHVDRYELSPSEQEKAPLWIIRKDGEFYWASKEYTPVAFVPSGLYDLFVSYTGMGTVKVNIEDGQCEYMENLQEKFGSITYYGDCTVNE